MKLLIYPDPRLGRAAAAVDTFGPALDPIIEGIATVMHIAGAIGLSAPHCDIALRVVVIQRPGEERLVLVNPSILESSDEIVEHEEGSVSMPGIRATIARPDRIRVGFQDRDGASHELPFAGFDAAITLHEIDQLDGIFWLQRLSRLKRDRAIKRYTKLSHHS